jgi:hypothetical protein
VAIARFEERAILKDVRYWGKIENPSLKTNDEVIPNAF